MSRNKFRGVPMSTWSAAALPSATTGVSQTHSDLCSRLESRPSTQTVDWRIMKRPGGHQLRNRASSGVGKAHTRVATKGFLSDR